MTVGVDVGGTFTDIAWWDGVRVRVGKTSSTPDQSDGVLEGTASLLDGAATDRLLHGTTVATNALLERTGARTVLVADSGFGDVLAIGRQERPSLYDVAARRPAPLVPADRRVEVAGRTGVPDADVLERLLREVRDLDPEAIAIVSLYAYLDEERERAIAAALAPIGVPVVRSSVVAPEFREFERASTTVLNAYLIPPMEGYLGSLGARAPERGLPDRISVMRSSGGLMGLDGAATLPAAALLSGPAGGVVATAAIARALGDGRVVAFDMGGTSTDVCRIEGGAPEVSFERHIAGFPCRLPSVAVHTVGAGGGSLGWADSGGALRVGPRSAGANPGPASYGRGGTDPAVTDANVVLGRIAPDAVLGDRVAVNPRLAEAAVAALGKRVGLGMHETALGMLEVVEAHMERAIRAVSVEEGADPRGARLVAFGGAGGLHATALARRIGMRGVVIPPYAGVFSAVGLLLAPPRHDVARSVAVDDFDAVAAAVDRAAEEATAGLSSMGAVAAEVERAVDVRYLGQAHEVSVPFDGLADWVGLANRFHAAHAARNGFSREGDPIEVVTVRAAALAHPAVGWEELPPVSSSGPATIGTRQLLLPSGPVEASVVRRGGLAAGDEVAGPAVIEEGEATSLLMPGERALVHESGALEVAW
ncbi:MAG: hydantoinase/oxoprolinase family protein [Acidimicrobiia bacterium]|nr:hydantoinase/oxoprolinase family protein [Acidimicrobiia bacterium]